MKRLAYGLALTFAVLAAAAPVRAARNAVENSVTIPSSAFTSDTANMDQDGFWTLDRRGRIAVMLDFPGGGLQTFVAMLRSGSDETEWPRVSIQLDSQPVFDVTVNTTNWASYTFACRAEKGLHELSFSFDPDFRSGEEDPAFQLHSLVVITDPKSPLARLPDPAAIAELDAERQRRRGEIAERQVLERRRGRLTVWVVEPTGMPATNALVSVRQRTHEFVFGAALCRDMFTRSATNDEAALYRDTFRRHFNGAATGDALDWPLTEPAAGRDVFESADRMADWCDREGIPLRAERLFHGCNVPGWAQKLDVRELRAAVGGRAAGVATRFRGQLNDYDVVTEPLRCGFFEDRLDPRVVVPIADRILAINPGARLRINEDGLFTRDMLDRFANYIRGQITAGVDIAGISAQAHFESAPNATELSARLDDLARLERPIAVAGFDCSATNEEDRVAALRTVLTAAFAHPTVEAVLFSGFWEGCHPVPSFALFDGQFKPTALGAAYLDLVYGTWWTRAEGRTDRVGRFECEAFFGDYDIEASTSDGRVARATLHIFKSHGSGGVSLHLPSQPPPAPPPEPGDTPTPQPAQEKKVRAPGEAAAGDAYYEPASW